MERKFRKKPVKPIIEGLNVGESAAYPIERIDVVKTTACIVGIKLGRSYSTTISRESRTIEVTRTL